MTGESNVTWDGTQFIIRSSDAITSFNGSKALTLQGGDAVGEYVNLAFNGNGYQLGVISGYTNATSNNGAGSLIFSTNNSGSITSRLVINQNGHTHPSTDSTYDLGLTGTRWRNVYADTLYGDGSNLTGISGVSVASQANNRLITATGTTDALNGESGLTFDGTTLQVLTSLSGTREQINLKNQNASAGTSRINFFSTVSGTEFAVAAIRNGVYTVNKGRLYLQVNKGSGLTNALEVYETGLVKVTNGSLNIEGGGLGFLTNNSTIQTGSSGNMLGIQGGATNMGGRIEFRGGNSDGDIRFYAQGATSTQVERLRIKSDGMIEMRSNMSASGNAEMNVFRFTDTDTSTVANQSMGKLQWFSSDSSGGGACVKAEIESTCDDTTPEARIIFKTPTGSGTTPT